jgi:hypothetical protein
VPHAAPQEQGPYLTAPPAGGPNGYAQGPHPA